MIDLFTIYLDDCYAVNFDALDAKEVERFSLRKGEYIKGTQYTFPYKYGAPSEIYDLHIEEFTYAAETFYYLHVCGTEIYCKDLEELNGQFSAFIEWHAIDEEAHDQDFLLYRDGDSEEE